MTQDRLSRALELAARDLSRAVDRPDEAALLAYLSGTANEMQIHQVREAIATSAEFRGDVAEFGRTLEQIGDADTAVRFDCETVPRAPSYDALRAPDGPRPAAAARSAKAQSRRIGRLLELFRRPAFAYALMVALLAYPAYRTFFASHRAAPAESPVRESVALFLREDRGRSLRGETAAVAPPEVEVSRGVLLALSLEAPESEGPWRVTVTTGDGQEIWQGPVPLFARTANEERIVSLSLDPGKVPAGPVTIWLARVTPAGAEPARYRFVLAVEPE